MNTRMVLYGYDLPHGSMVLYKVPTLLLGMVMLTKLVLTQQEINNIGMCHINIKIVFTGHV